MTVDGVSLVFGIAMIAIGVWALVANDQVFAMIRDVTVDAELKVRLLFLLLHPRDSDSLKNFDLGQEIVQAPAAVLVGMGTSELAFF